MENFNTAQVKVFTETGEYITLEQWQDYYGLPVGSDKVGHYFSVSGDRRLRKNLADYGELVICAPLMKVADETRRLWGRPLKLNDFNRTEQKQQWLIANGFPAGKNSTHVEKMALDFDTKTNQESLALGKVILKASCRLGIAIRLGVQKYIDHPFTLVHLDVAPEYYGVNKPYYHRPHPQAWEKEVRF